MKVEEVKPLESVIKENNDTQQPEVDSNKTLLQTVDSKDEFVNKKRKKCTETADLRGQYEMGFGSKIMLMIM